MQVPGGGGISIPIVVVFAWLLAASASEARAEADAQWQALDAHMKDCTHQFGYDPANVSDLGPHQLGVGERKWRDCVYDGLQKLLMAGSVIPEVYQEFINDDRRMTDAVERQEMTRDDRRSQLMTNVRNIKLSEQVNQAAAKDSNYSFIQYEQARMQQMRQFERLVIPRISNSIGR